MSNKFKKALEQIAALPPGDNAYARIIAKVVLEHEASSPALRKLQNKKETVTKH